MANNRLRIVSGSFGGLFIDAPKNSSTHPMGERERMAIFNRLRDEISGKHVLDAFAGSGAIGIEALSIGAEHVDFMENNAKAIACIKNNLVKTKCSDKATILRAPSGEYDLIFADPPYDNPQYDIVSALLAHLKEGGFFVLSHPENPEPPKFDQLELLSDKKYAAAHIKIFQKTQK
ncbi:RsmD family RNA methyltransferase [Candidatus Saccharibacteria bacterium]|nr:RsmD family RNA methyltransferase [Candidatus Saccharibacteria bacterium]